MPEDMFNIASRVQDEKSFLDFLESLAADRKDELTMEKEKPSSPTVLALKDGRTAP